MECYRTDGRETDPKTRIIRACTMALPARPGPAGLQVVRDKHRVKRHSSKPVSLCIQQLRLIRLQLAYAY